jgi:hypothetical protein
VDAGQTARVSLQWLGKACLLGCVLIIPCSVCTCVHTHPAPYHPLAPPAVQPAAPHLVQLLHHLRLLLLAAIPHAEPFLKLLRAVEHLGQQEVEQRPQLVQVVLQRRARDEQAVVGAQQADHLGQDAVLVLDAVRLPSWVGWWVCGCFGGGGGRNGHTRSGTSQGTRTGA